MKNLSNLINTKVLYFSPINQFDGVGHVARLYLNYLLKYTNEIYVLDKFYYSGWHENDFKNFFKNVKFISETDIKNIKFDIFIQHAVLTIQTYKQFNIPVNAKKKIFLTWWETDRFPEKMTEKFKDFDYTGFCSDFGCQIQPSYNPIKLNLIEEKSLISFKTSNNNKIKFYTILAPTERKNIIQTVRCFKKAFGNSKAVEFNIKLTFSKSFDNKKIIEEIINKSEIKNYENINFVGNSYESDEFINNLHKNNDIFYLSQHSEGFGVNQYDAIRFGNPCVTNNFGGISEFCTSENSFLIPYYLDETSKKYNNQNDYIKNYNSRVYNFANSRWAYFEDNKIIDSLKLACDNYKIKQNQGIDIKNFSFKNFKNNLDNIK